ncbi:hypothetical protein [Dyella sp.]|uniref:hypothetical protein n=1 Tax=Dyella sp. TaxID=1869338 RepID=UPI003F809DE4
MEIDWIKLTDEALHVASGVVTGVVLAYCGLRIYFIQKEYELVKQRYLDQCLDVVAGELEEITSVFLHNWARSLELVKELRDAPENFEKAHLDQGFIPFRGSNFNQAAHHRLRVLTGSRIFWDCYQIALAQHMAMNAIAAKEIPHAISEHLSGRLVGAKASDVVATAINELKPMSSKSSEFALLHNSLQRIAAELERSRLSFEKIETFAKRANVLEIIKELEEQFGPQLHDEKSAD